MNPPDDARSPVEVGQYAEFSRSHGNVHVRVMAVEENWAMVRRPGCIPFVVSLGDYVGPSDKIKASVFG